MTVTDPHPVDVARARKVGELLRVIIAHRVGIDLLEALLDSGWATLARAAGVREPSETTRRYVLEACRAALPAWYDVERELEPSGTVLLRRNNG